MAEEKPSQLPYSIQVLIVSNRLIIKAFNAKNRQSLIFTILNDTVHVIPYDRALLWEMKEGGPKLIGISGQTEVNPDAEITKEWEGLVERLHDHTKPQILSEESFPHYEDEWRDIQQRSDATILWLPIYTQDKLVLGLWLEKWYADEKEKTLTDNIDLFMNFLMPGYGSAWLKFTSKVTIAIQGVKKKYVWAGLLGLLVFLFIIHVPLRVVAPCEIVPKDPYLVTAPLEGIVEEVVVEPGDEVEKGQVLFEYNKIIPMQDLKIAEKDVEITNAEVYRSATLGLEEEKSLADLSIFRLKLEKAEIKLNLARYNASLLTYRAPIQGVVMLSDPDEWRGKPVKVGEKIMMIGGVDQTKVRIWIPEADNIMLNPDAPIKVYLNVNPEISRKARLLFVSNESTVNEQNVPSFLAEADWIEPQEGLKLGLKGSAILYGERVTLFYYLFRKPWWGLRYLLGF